MTISAVCTVQHARFAMKAQDDVVIDDDTLNISKRRYRLIAWWHWSVVVDLGLVLG